MAIRSVVVRALIFDSRGARFRNKALIFPSSHTAEHATGRKKNHIYLLYMGRKGGVDRLFEPYRPNSEASCHIHVREMHLKSTVTPVAGDIMCIREKHLLRLKTELALQYLHTFAMPALFGRVCCTLGRGFVGRDLDDVR